LRRDGDAAAARSSTEWPRRPAARREDADPDAAQRGADETMLFPLGDDNTQRRITPHFVWLIIIINAVVWIMQLTLGDSFTYGFSAIPYEITNGVDLVRAQMLEIAGEAIEIPQARGPVPIQLTIFSSMFMHASWMHIIGNMLYLWIFGDQIEDILGHWRFVVFYVLCGVAASFSHIMVGPGSVIPSLGASGAIAGVLGAYLVKHPRNNVRVLMGRGVVVMPAFVVLGFWIVLQLFSQVQVPGGESTGVAYMAHIGGFFAGVILVFIMAVGRPSVAPPRRERDVRLSRRQPEREITLSPRGRVTRRTF
jgi:membrane associated rhomboid family serine protease